MLLNLNELNPRTRIRCELEPFVPAVAVMLYVNRSGSTLLSRLLSEFSDELFVFPELGSLVDIVLMLGSGLELSGHELHSILKADPRLEALGLSDDALGRACSSVSSNDLKSLLGRIATASLGRAPRAIMIKHERFVELLALVEMLLSPIAYVGLIRDPRAVTSSMLRSPVPEKPGFNMARDSVLFAVRRWRTYINKVDRLAIRRRVFRVRFEDLRAPTFDQTCSQIMNELGIQGRKEKKSTRGTLYRTALIDKPLHPKAYEEFDERRTSAWRTELAARDASVIEHVCHDKMIPLGYLAIARNASRPVMLNAFLRHGVATSKHLLTSAWRHLHQGSVLRALRYHWRLRGSRASDRAWLASLPPRHWRRSAGSPVQD